jgi:hypothetical protein
MSNLLLSKRGALLAAAFGTALVLSACGGSSNDSPGTGTPPVAGTPTTPPFASDSFFDYVSARAYSLLEVEEPESIDAVTETKPEDTEPKPVG